MIPLNENDVNSSSRTGALELFSRTVSLWTISPQTPPERRCLIRNKYHCLQIFRFGDDTVLLQLQTATLIEIKVENCSRQLLDPPEERWWHPHATGPTPLPRPKLHSWSPEG